MTATLDRIRRDLGEGELWERSLARSRRRRERRAPDEIVPRSLVSEALLDLDGPRLRQVGRDGVIRDLTDPEVWDISQSWARAQRLAAEPGMLPQARVAGATLVVAAVAAALPVPGGTQNRAKSSGATEVRVQLLRYGSRGPAVAKVQRRLGIPADGIFGPQTRAAVRTFRAPRPARRRDRRPADPRSALPGPRSALEDEVHPRLVGLPGPARPRRPGRRPLRAGEQSSRHRLPEEARAHRGRGCRAADPRCARDRPRGDGSQAHACEEGFQACEEGGGEALEPRRARGGDRAEVPRDPLPLGR